VLIHNPCEKLGKWDWEPIYNIFASFCESIITQNKKKSKEKQSKRKKKNHSSRGLLSQGVSSL
jgi:hypothetical protein